MVYSAPDFDAPVVTTLKVGGVYDISTGKKGAFYKIRLRPGSVAWIADNDIHPGIVKEAIAYAEAQKKQKHEAKKNAADEEADFSKKPKKPFDMQRFRGPSLDMVQYREATLGGHPTDNLLFYGFKVAGPNTMFEGDTNTEANLMVHMGAPSYYKKATGNTADGWIFMTHFLFENTNPVSRNYNYFYGFGPMFRYSHFNLGLTSAGKTVNYSADDMTLGAVFNFGLAFKISDYALRLDAQFYWEKQMYAGGGLSFGFPF